MVHFDAVASVHVHRSTFAADAYRVNSATIKQKILTNSFASTFQDDTCSWRLDFGLASGLLLWTGNLRVRVSGLGVTTVGPVSLQ